MSDGPLRVVVFGFDAAESSQIRRFRGLAGCGYEVDGYTFRRENMDPGSPPSWRNVDLGRVENEALGRRVLSLVKAVGRVWRNLGPIRRADVVMARNFDLLLLAWTGRTLARRPKLPLIYECLDIHGSFTGSGLKARAFRAVERFLLKRTALLVVSSPGFIEHYFEPVQGYRGPVRIIENKIWFDGTPPERRENAENMCGGRPWVIGWVGSLRCDPSLSILLHTAARMGERVRIEMHGNVHHHVVPDFERRIADLPNVAYHGPYAYPEGLAEVYRGCDLVWSQDLWQRGANSDWLLPNRIYEASYFGCLSIAVDGTQTASTVRERDLGYTIAEPSADALASLIDGLDADEVCERRRALLARPASEFVYAPDDLTRVVDAAMRKDR